MSFPKIIYFCNKTLDKMAQYSYIWKKLNPEYEIKLYDNKMCEKFLLEEYGELHRDIFNFLKDGPIKADFWRICILNMYGGVYSDIDNQPFIPIDQFIEKDVDFVTCSSYSLDMNFNPNFIISNKDNIILKTCIEWYIYHYKIKKTYGYWEWSIMRAFSDTLHLENYDKMDGIYYLDKMKIQILKECPGAHHYDAHNIYKNQRIFNNRYISWDFNSHSFR